MLWQLGLQVWVGRAVLGGFLVIAGLGCSGRALVG